MFPIDEQIEYVRIQQFASQVPALSEAERELFEAHFSDAGSADFNLGLLAGYANACALAADANLSRKQKSDTLGKLVAFVADKIAQRGL